MLEAKTSQLEQLEAKRDEITTSIDEMQTTVEENYSIIEQFDINTDKSKKISSEIGKEQQT